ncbi:ABC transporter substrate-binding protein [Paenibacillus sacheonensis]|uniref:Extracellular solute-binding protein n=1 Tax=Paenibacillus sacheonensis TaxID=742054 RepID=A0A7X4YV00_9BACL|nr:ABC transporter substrate-binding protein [Paenibacillus sacheonensis]MBM7567757.1 putative aldouronate transport system substrate-binding protein [Paenibacillus sacheonensis]NBC71969.1 extracellular solute-binding protein [Paenibacillus sacheonensis]
MNRSNRIFAFALMLTVVALISACRGETGDDVSENQDSADVPQPYVTLKMIMPGDESARMREFVDNELNERLKNELNMKLDLTYIPWSDYQSKLELALSTGENYDLFWYGTPFVPEYKAKNYIQPLDALLRTYGKDLTRNIPADNFKQDEMDGKLWAIPSQAFTSAGKFTSVMVRQDLLESVGMKSIRSIADLEAFYSKMHAVDPSYYGYLETDRGQDVQWREQSEEPLTFLDENQMFAVNERTGQLVDYLQSDLYRKVVQVRERWVDMGLIDKRLVGNLAANIDQEDAGKLLFRVGAVSRAMENLQTVQNADAGAKLREYYLSPDKPKYIVAPSNEAYMIPVDAVHPERAMQFMNWILQSKEHYNFIIYGVEGKDYRIENGKIKLLTNDQFMYEWMWRNKNYFMATTSVDDSVVQDMLHNDDNARISRLFGFHFNQEPVKNEYANVLAVYNEKFVPINMGIVGYDEQFGGAMSALKKAGYDRVWNELQRQYLAFRAGQTSRADQGEPR